MRMMIVPMLFVAIIVGAMVLASISPWRTRKLNHVLADLEELRKRAEPNTIYALGENIAFFKAIRTLPGYIYWALTRRHKIDGSRLLEIADLPLPRWERELYEDLSHVERKEFPGLSKPLRDILINHIQETPGGRMLDLGCGSMEVERQTIVQLQRRKIKAAPIFIGVDLAPQAWDAIQDNFLELADADEVELVELKSIEGLDHISVTKPTILFHCGDALKVAELRGHLFSLILSSRFRHHLDDGAKKRMDTMSRRLTHYVVEYDDYRTAFSWIPPLLTAWYRPILLNGAIFSQIRQPAKKDLLGSARAQEEVRFFSPPGSYARFYLSSSDKGVGHVAT